VTGAGELDLHLSLALPSGSVAPGKLARMFHSMVACTGSGRVDILAQPEMIGTSPDGMTEDPDEVDDAVSLSCPPTFIFATQIPCSQPVIIPVISRDERNEI